MATQRLTSRRRQDQGSKWVRIVMAVLATVGVIDTGSITLKFWGVLGDLTCPMGAGGCDISRVLFTLPRKGGDHLSGIAVTDDLERRTLAERGRWPPVVPRPCSQPGFTEPAPLDAAGALLPHLCTLACAGGTGHRRCVSVALSSRSPALGITQQAWPSGSPDFPQPMTAARRQHPSIAITSPTFNPHNGL